MSLKTALKRTLLTGWSALARLRGVRPIDDPAGFWDKHYRAGGISGSGSRGRLAAFKAEFLNDLVAENRIRSVIEFGSGDGVQLSLASYPSYLGVDVSRAAVERCRQMFAGQRDRAFVHIDELPPGTMADLALSLDVVFHLVHDTEFDSHMRRLFDAARLWVVIYSSDFDRFDAPLLRHRRFSRWIAEHRPEFRLERVVSNRYPFDPLDPDRTSWAEFHVYRRASA
jgi:hypothetical protein